jgi:hypothetical protein
LGFGFINGRNITEKIIGVGVFDLAKYPGGFLYAGGGVTLCYKIYGGTPVFKK